MRQEIELTPNRPMSPTENKDAPSNTIQPEEEAKKEAKEEKTDPEQSELWNQKN